MKINTPLMTLFMTAVVSLGVLLMQRQVHQDRDRAVAEATRTIDGILSEAQQALEINRAFLGQPCTPQLARQLGRSASLSPHLRGVRLLQEGLTVCASLSGAPDLSLQPLESGQLQLLLLRGDGVTPRSPVVVLTERFPEGQVAVSLSGVFIREALEPSRSRPALVFRTTDREMDAQGRVRSYSPEGGFHPSGTYPFVLVPDPLSSVPGMNLLRDVLPWLLLSMIPAALAPLLCQRLLHRCCGPQARFLRALKRGDIRPWYQPVMDSRTGALAGCEVLARWKTRRGRFLLPDRFIPLAERSGLTIPLTQSLLSQVARDLEEIRGELPADFHLAFNISSAHAGDITLVRHCRTLQAALPGVILVAEITERERFVVSPELPALLPALRAAGVKVALDDFGTGYAGLASLDTLQVDFIKLDCSFTAQITETNLAGERMLMAEVITDMACRLKLGVVAEGVETACQRAWLTGHGVGWLQGYLFSRPLPADRFLRFVQEFRLTDEKVHPSDIVWGLERINNQTHSQEGPDGGRSG